MSVFPICEKLRRTEKRKSYMATNATAPIIESEYEAPINPDGPEAARTIEALYEALKDVEGLIGESTGVIGFHLNGDVAEWGYFDELLAKISAALKQARGEQ